MLKYKDNEYLKLFLSWLRAEENKLHYVNLIENFTRENFINTLKVFNRDYFAMDIPIETSKLTALFQLLEYNKEHI